MARPLRVQSSGALYHVTARGNSRKPIFCDERDRPAQVRKYLSQSLSADAQARSACDQQPPPVLCRRGEGPLHLPRQATHAQDRELTLPALEFLRRFLRAATAPHRTVGRTAEKPFSVRVAVDERSLRTL